MVEVLTNNNIKDAVNLCCVNFIHSYEIYGDISEWDVSRVTDMSELFKDKLYFNYDISNWDVSNVTNMESMFYKAKSFNHPLNNWNVSNVTNMKKMFCCADSFNQPLDTKEITKEDGSKYIAWDVSNVTNMQGIFLGAFNFNQDLSSWNIDLDVLSINEHYSSDEELDEINVDEISKQLAEFELDKECHICQNTETNNNIVKVNCCDNNYHKDCLIKWFNIDNTCPTCREEF